MDLESKIIVTLVAPLALELPFQLWHNSKVIVWLERFFLAVLAAILVGAVFLNILKLDNLQRALLGLGILFLSLFAGYTISLSRQPGPPEIEAPKDEAAKARVASGSAFLSDVAIEITYDLNMMGLPIPVQPYTSVIIIRIKDRNKVEAMTFENSERKVAYWPKEKSGFPPQGVGIVKFANHGTVAVFNIVAAIGFDLGAQRSPGGVTTVQFRLPLIESLRPNDPPVQFYVVDESSLGGLVRLPETVVADVPSAGRKNITIKPRNLTFLDNIPMLPPTFPNPSAPSAKKPKKSKH